MSENNEQPSGSPLASPHCSAFDESIAIATGCLDYGGGYRGSERELSVFHHGIQTVINALSAARKAEQAGENDTQVNALRRMGYSQQNITDTRQK
jgi:hypothetical protein